MRNRPTVSQLRERALELVEEDPEQSQHLAREAVRRQPDAESHYVLGIVLCDTDSTDEGIAALRTAVELEPTHAEAWVALGREWFDSLLLEEAREALRAALRVDNHHPEALYYRACLRERRGDYDGAARDYQAAALVDGDAFPIPEMLDDEAIEAAAEQVIRSLHPSLQKYLENVAILVEEVPDTELLQQFVPPAHPLEVLGCFAGHALTERSTLDAWSTLPATIVLFRRNLMRMAHDREAMQEELRVKIGRAHV